MTSSSPSSISPFLLSSLLTAPSAKEAFSKISTICPNWEAWEREGTIYLRPDRIEARGREESFPILEFVGNGFGESYDAAILRYEEKLMAKASGGAVVVVDSNSRRAEYVYSAEEKAFKPHVRPGRTPRI